MSAAYDVVIVGGGVIGSAVAYHLCRDDPGLQVAVVERDPGYERASSTLSMANIRIQFSLPENIRISQHAFEVLENFSRDMAVEGRAPDPGFRREGNLFLVDAGAAERARAAFDLQTELGCPVQWWSAKRIQAEFALYEPGGLQATYGPRDGHIDAYAVLMGYRAKARSLGAEYRHAEVAAVAAEGGRVTGVRLVDGSFLAAAVVVNCAGAWCARVAASVGVDLPVQPVKRQVFVLDPAVHLPGPLPLTILPSGLYFRTETGGLILVGKSQDDDPVGFDFGWDEKRFYDFLWEELADFVPAFEELRLVRGWAGLYAVNTLDGNAILGEWPGLKGFYLANGFSGHGLQQAPAAGRYITECILGRTPALDLSIFHPGRIFEKRPLTESGLV